MIATITSCVYSLDGLITNIRKSKISLLGCTDSEKAGWCSLRSIINSYCIQVKLSDQCSNESNDVLSGKICPNESMPSSAYLMHKVTVAYRQTPLVASMRNRSSSPTVLISGCPERLPVGQFATAESRFWRNMVLLPSR